MLRPIAAPGSARSIRGSFAVRSESASIEISTPGAITPPRYSPRAGDDVEVGRRPEVDGDARAPTRSNAATALTSLSAPSSRGLSIFIAIPVLTLGPTMRQAWGRLRSHICAYSGPSCGTTVETIEPSIDPVSIPAAAAGRTP